MLCSREKTIANRIEIIYFYGPAQPEVAAAGGSITVAQPTPKPHKHTSYNHWSSLWTP
jgi:hypothetical protein